MMTKKIKMLICVVLTLITIAGCGNVVDGPGMVNTEYEQGY